MPKATVDSKSTERKDLKSCPPDGYVVLRRMTYREFLKRRDMSSGMSFKGQSQKDMEATLKASNEAVTKYEFARCVVEHNLEDDKGKKINFNGEDAFDQLDPRIGEEIAEHIDNMNQFNREDDDGVPLTPESEQA